MKEKCIWQARLNNDFKIQMVLYITEISTLNRDKWMLVRASGIKLVNQADSPSQISAYRSIEELKAASEYKYSWKER